MPTRQANDGRRRKRRCRRSTRTHTSMSVASARNAQRAPNLRQALRRPRPTTAWPCAPADGRGLDSEWLERAVVKIVTTYSQPGHRVLLVHPPPPQPTEPPRWTTTRNWRADPYATLEDTNWTISHLGRSVQTTLAAHPDHSPTAHPVIGSDHGRSGYHTLHAPSGSAEAPRDRDHPQTPDLPCRDCFDLILTAAHPRDHGWIAAHLWPRLLRPHGTLAIITHCDTTSDRLVDPTTRLAITVRDSGLNWLDHIVLLTSVRSDVTIGADTGKAGWRPARHERTHHDLLVFATPAGQE